MDTKLCRAAWCTDSEYNVLEYLSTFQIVFDYRQALQQLTMYYKYIRTVGTSHWLALL